VDGLVRSVMRRDGICQVIQGVFTLGVRGFDVEFPNIMLVI